MKDLIKEIGSPSKVLSTLEDSSELKEVAGFFDMFMDALPRSHSGLSIGMKEFSFFGRQRTLSNQYPWDSYLDGHFKRLNEMLKKEKKRVDLGVKAGVRGSQRRNLMRQYNVLVKKEEALNDVVKRVSSAARRGDVTMTGKAVDMLDGLYPEGEAKLIVAALYLQFMDEVRSGSQRRYGLDDFIRKDWVHV